MQSEQVEKVKQPAGVLPASKTSNSQPLAHTNTIEDLRMLVLADANASFYNIVKQTSTDTKAPPFMLSMDPTLPQYP